MSKKKTGITDASHAPAATESAQGGVDAAPRPRRRVLVVDDHRDTADALVLLLGAQGYETAQAGSVAAALALAGQGFDVVISDLGLPDGTGMDLVRALRARGPVRAIALSGYGSAADVEASKRAGFTGHITKPVQFASLLEAVRGALDEEP